MKKILKIILLAGIILILLGIGFITLVKKGVVPLDYSRTFYKGYVEIEPVSLVDIETKLVGQGCQKYNQNVTTTMAKPGGCMYTLNISNIEQPNMYILPRGAGFGPGFSITLTKNRLYTEADLTGSPNKTKYLNEIRQHVADIGNIITIKENTLTLTDTTYPWDVIY